MYYILFQILIQEHFVLSSITCVNSMEVSYIPIAKARGFTTHWIKYYSTLKNPFNSQHNQGAPEHSPQKPQGMKE